MFFTISPVSQYLIVYQINSQVDKSSAVKCINEAYNKQLQERSLQTLRHSTCRMS